MSQYTLGSNGTIIVDGQVLPNASWSYEAVLPVEPMLGVEVTVSGEWDMYEWDMSRVSFADVLDMARKIPASRRQLRMHANAMRRKRKRK